MESKIIMPNEQCYIRDGKVSGTAVPKVEYIRADGKCTERVLDIHNPENLEIAEVIEIDPHERDDQLIPVYLESKVGERKRVRLVPDLAYRLEYKWKQVREDRDARLQKTDWTQMTVDNGLPVELKNAYAIYRQALRDVPQNNEDPDNIDWPNGP